MRDLILNKPQLNFLARLPEMSAGATCIWGRRTGKSFIIAVLIDAIRKRMPGSVGFILGASFKQLLTNTLRSTFQALDEMGYRRNVSYVIGIKPPVGWVLPGSSPHDFSNIVTFYHPACCMLIQLISQDKSSTSPRGSTFDFGIRDECLLIDQSRYNSELKPALSGTNRAFRNVPFYRQVFDFSSMPYCRDTKYLLDRSKYYDGEFDFTLLRDKMVGLQLRFCRTNDAEERLDIWGELSQLDRALNFYTAKKGKLKGHLYSEANIFDNMAIVGPQYIIEQHRDLPDLVFLIEVLNKRIYKVEGGFYPTFDRKIHTYRGTANYGLVDSFGYDLDRVAAMKSEVDADLVKGLPLQISMDWGSSINFMVVGQPIKSLNRLNIINNFYAKNKTYHPVISQFIEYYKHHDHKEVDFIYDPQGNKKVANSNLTFAEDCVEMLRKAGWIVYQRSVKASYMLHKDKYNFFVKVWSQPGVHCPDVMINEYKCPELIVSIENARLKLGDSFEKDKSDEKKTYLNQSETTHATDALDYLALYNAGSSRGLRTSAFADIGFGSSSS